MKKVVDKFSEYINYFLIFSIIVLFFRNFICGHTSSYQYNIILWILIIPLLIIYLYKIKNKEIKIDKYDIIMYIFFFFLMLSTIFSIHIRVSTIGSVGRNEGLLSFIAYILVFLNAKGIKDEKMVKRIINCLLVFGIIQFIYCVFQVFFRFDFIKVFSLYGIRYMASGFIGNPNFLGSIVVILLSLSTIMWFLENKKIYLILTVIFFVNLIFAQSTGPFFAYCFTFVFCSIFLWIKKKIDLKKILGLFLMLIGVFIIVSNSIEWYCKSVYNDNFMSHYTIKGDIENTFNLMFNKDRETSDTIQGGNINAEMSSQNYGSGRLAIWKNSLKIVPKYFWIGSGLDTFGWVYPDQGSVFYDKAHNEYLQLLVTSGVYTLITYLVLLSNIFIDGVRSNNKLVWILLVTFVGYVLQAFLNISVVNVAPIFYMIMGMLCSLFSRKKV